MIEESALMQSNGDLECAGLATRLVLAAADVAMVLDGRGVVQDVVFGSDELAREVDGNWVGLDWEDTVIPDSRAVVGELLREGNSGGERMRWREVMHATRHGEAIPVRYAVAKLPKKDRLVAIGRDLQAVTALQQQLGEAQQALERDYWQLRQMETRYRILFQTATDAVLIVEAGTLKVVEANPVAIQLLGQHERDVLGRVFPVGFDDDSHQALLGLLAAVRSSGRADAVRGNLVVSGEGQIVSAALLRQENITLFLVRIMPLRKDRDASMSEAMRKLLRVFELAPDAVVLTTADGRVTYSNPAFLDLAQLASEEQARGVMLDRWLGRPGIDLNVLLANLRQHGAVRLFATIMRGAYGSNADVEVSGVAISSPERAGFGFIIRNVGRRVSPETRPGKELPRSVEQLTELVGRVPLKELVRESTDLIERLCIEAALDLTGDNRASAAELLGLSRQSLYVKLRRYGISDNAAAEER